MRGSKTIMLAEMVAQVLMRGEKVWVGTTSEADQRKIRLLVKGLLFGKEYLLDNLLIEANQ